jgi:mitotic spindle assembly checkpoint protein MAD1
MRRVASGEYNPSRERLLELKNNPASREFAIRTKTLEDLKAENQALLDELVKVDTRVAEGDAAGMEGQEQGVLGLVPRMSYERLLREKEDLERAHAKRLLRLKEVSQCLRVDILHLKRAPLAFQVVPGTPN